MDPVLRQPSLRDRVTDYGGELAKAAREAHARRSFIEARTLWRAASGLSEVLGLGPLPELVAAEPAEPVPAGGITSPADVRMVEGGLAPATETVIEGELGGVDPRVL